MGGLAAGQRGVHVPHVQLQGASGTADPADIAIVVVSTMGKTIAGVQLSQPWQRSGAGPSGRGKPSNSRDQAPSAPFFGRIGVLERQEQRGEAEPADQAGVAGEYNMRAFRASMFFRFGKTVCRSRTKDEGLGPMPLHV